MADRLMKFQEPRCKFQTNTKTQGPNQIWNFSIGTWSLFGSWYLVLGGLLDKCNQSVFCLQQVTNKNIKTERSAFYNSQQSYPNGGNKINKKGNKQRQSRKGRKGRRNKEMVQLAKERIERLFKLAELEALDHNFERADRYVKLARKIGMRYNVRCPKEYKRRFCKHCLSYILPDVNSRVRIRNGKIVIYCNVCSKYTRLPINKKVKIQQDRLTEKIRAE